MTAPIFPLLNASDEVKSYLEFGGILRAFEFGLAPDKPKPPYLVWQDVSGTPQNHLDCPANIDHITIQVDIYTTKADDLRNIREAVRRAFELDNSCTVTGLRGNERDPDSKMYRTGFDSNWFVDR